MKPVRYAYGVTAALLLGGATLSLATGLPAGAQVAQNDASRIQSAAPPAGAPASFDDLTEQLAPAVVLLDEALRAVLAHVRHALAEVGEEAEMVLAVGAELLGVGADAALECLHGVSRGAPGVSGGRCGQARR